MDSGQSLTECVGGKVAEIVTEGKAEVTSKKGNVISKNASEDNPAVKIKRSGVSWAGTPVFIYRISSLSPQDARRVCAACGIVAHITQNDAVKRASELNERDN